MKTISIRKASEADFPSIFSLIQELAEFEKAKDGVKNTVALMKEEQEFFECLVAENEKHEIVGYALYFYAYYTWVGKSLYLDDLYVQAKYRRMGIGNKLLDAVLLSAREQNCKRIRWQVLDWNTSAQEFYKQKGAEIITEWYNCDVHIG